MDDKFEKYKWENRWANRWAVVGFDYDTAKQLIANIEVSCGKEVSFKSYNKYGFRVEFTDGTLLKWVKADDNSRGQKFGKMWCDKNIDKDVLQCKIMPMYFGKKEDIIWV